MAPSVLQGFHLGDSAKHEQKRTWQTFFAEVERCKNLETPWTLELRDPLANSFVSSVLEDPRKDPRMQVWILKTRPMKAYKMPCHPATACRVSQACKLLLSHDPLRCSEIGDLQKVLDDLCAGYEKHWCHADGGL